MMTGESISSIMTVFADPTTLFEDGQIHALLETTCTSATPDGIFLFLEREEAVKSQSEMTLLRERIGYEVKALRRLKHGFATVASHAIIMRHYDTLGSCLHKLAHHVGEEIILEAVLERLDQVL